MYLYFQQEVNVMRAMMYLYLQQEVNVMKAMMYPYFQQDASSVELKTLQREQELLTKRHTDSEDVNTRLAEKNVALLEDITLLKVRIYYVVSRFILTASTKVRNGN